MNFVVQAQEVREQNGMVFAVKGPFTVTSHLDNGKRVGYCEPVKCLGLFDNHLLTELKKCPKGLGKKFKEINEALAK